MTQRTEAMDLAPEASTDGTGALEDILLAWCAEVTGAPVLQARRLVGGNRRRAWAVDVAGAAGSPRELFLRFASRAAAPGEGPYDLRREAAIYRALAPTDVLIPRIVAEHPSLEAVLIERVDGASSYRSIADSRERVQVAQDFMRALHQLHRLDPESLGLPPTQGMADAVRQELAHWRSMYESTGRGDPLIEFALRWLDGHVPQVATKPSLVHGDAGPGNFMFRGGRLVALLDWELWHLGDPVEDIAWLSMRCVLEPFPELALRVREYEALSGMPIDRDRLLYHRIFVALRVVVIRHRAMRDPSPDSDPGNSLVSRLLNRRLLVESLALAAGRPPDTPDIPDAPPTEDGPDYAYLLDQLRDVIAPSTRDPLVASRVKSMARIVKYLQQKDRLGGVFEQQELKDLQAALGASVDDTATGRTRLASAVRDARVEDAAALRYLVRQSARDTALGASALGALSRRSFDSLDAVTP